MVNLKRKVDSLIDNCRSKRNVLNRYYGWCTSALSPSQQDDLARRISFLTSCDSDDKRSKNMKERDNSNFKFCEPFYFHPRKFDCFIVLAGKGASIEQAKRGVLGFDPVSLIAAGNGSEDYSYNIGVTNIKVKFNPEKTRGLRIRYKHNGSNKRITDWKNYDRRKRMYLKGCLSYLSSNNGTYVNSIVGSYGHSHGWMDMVSGILDGRIPVVVDHVCTVAGIQDQLEFYLKSNEGLNNQLAELARHYVVPYFTLQKCVTSQFMQVPRKPHLDGVRHTLRYMSATTDYGLFYEASTELQVHGYVDADWAGSISDRRSTSGFMFSFGSAAVTWSSKKQPTVALSSTEAEYRGAAMAACEVAWLRKLLGDLGLHVDRQVVIYCDNLSSIQLARNPVFHARTKHIEVHYHFIREKVLAGEIDLIYVNTEDQVVDIFTKVLGAEKHR